MTALGIQFGRLNFNSVYLGAHMLYINIVTPLNTENFFNKYETREKAENVSD